MRHNCDNNENDRIIPLNCGSVNSQKRHRKHFATFRNIVEGMEAILRIMRQQVHARGSTEFAKISSQMKKMLSSVEAAEVSTTNYNFIIIHSFVSNQQMSLLFTVDDGKDSLLKR